MNVKAMAALCSLALVATATAQTRQLVSGYDFKTGTAMSNGITSYGANFGTGTLYWDGTHGSSTWLPYSSTSPYQIRATNGTRQNATEGGVSGGTPIDHYGFTYSTAVGTTDTDPNGIGFYQPANAGSGGVDANNQSIVFAFSMAGHEKLSLTYAGYFSTSGFSSIQWEYSSDATNWTLIGDQTTTTNGYAIYTPFEDFTGLDHVETAYIRATFNGASTTAGSDRLHVIDNMVFSAVAIPEPGATALVIAGAGAFGMYRYQKRRASRVENAK